MKRLVYFPAPLAQAFGSTEFKLKSGRNGTGYPPIYSVLSLSSPPLRAEKRDCILLSIISLARSSLRKIKNKKGLETCRNVLKISCVAYFASIRFLITNHLSPTFHQSWPMKSTAAPASPLTNHFSFLTAALAEAESLTSTSRDSRRSKFRRKIVVNLKSPGLQKKQFWGQTSRPSYSL
jgi:hypothetical protein